MRMSAPALETLSIVLAPGALDTAISMAEKESLGHLEFLHRLLAGPVEAKRERSLKRRLDTVRFRELITLEGFDWQFNAKGLDRRSIEPLVTCDFMRRNQNVILVGQTGLGKSRILQTVGQAACVLGYRVRYATSAELLQKFTEALADGSFNRMLKEYVRFDLLLIDEFGFDRLERDAQSQASTFYFRLLDARTGRHSTCLGTGFQWNFSAQFCERISRTTRIKVFTVQREASLGCRGRQSAPLLDGTMPAKVLPGWPPHATSSSNISSLARAVRAQSCQRGILVLRPPAYTSAGTSGSPPSSGTRAQWGRMVL